MFHRRSPLVVLGALLALAACSEENGPVGTSVSGDAPSSAARIAQSDPEPVVPGREPRGQHVVRRYEIVVENLTPATGSGASQVFSPPVITTHLPAVRMFEVGEIASEPLALIAEDAINAPMIDALETSRHAHEVIVGGGPILPGASATYHVESIRGFQHLSMAFMLVNTNDGFSGLNALKLPITDEIVIETMAYDAGSEPNTELIEHIPGPCCGSPEQGPSSSEPIAPHPGIQGDGDLDPAVYGWQGPVARITVRPVD